MRSIVFFIFTFLGAALLTGCYEPVEGCLNPLASNFDLDADEACVEECCTLPELKIRFDAIWVDAGEVFSLRTDTFYTDALGQPWRFKQLRYYWSDFSLDLIDGNSLRISDSLDIAIANGSDTTTINVRDDFMLADVDNASGRSTVGRFPASGILSGFRAVLGIRQPVNRGVTTSIANSHPLAPQFGLMNFGAETGYVFAKLEYFQDTTAADTTARVINIFGDDQLQDLALSLPTPTQMVEGFDQVLVIEQDISLLFSGINVREPDTLVLKSQFVNNLTQIFQLLTLFPE